MPFHPARRDIQRQFWSMIVWGYSITQSATFAGVSSTAAHQWFRNAGGVSPLALVVPVRTRALNIAEREEILAGINREESIRTIAAARSLPRAVHGQPGTGSEYAPRLSQGTGLGEET